MDVSIPYERKRISNVAEVRHTSIGGTHAFACIIFSPVSAKVKFVSRMYRNAFISIMEKRMPMQD
jgi:hypothetical protein